MRLNFLSLVILVVVVGAAVGGAYGSGVVVGKATTPALTQATATAVAASGSGAGGAAAGGAGGRGVSGTVEKLEGNTLSVSSTTGGSVQVTLSQNTPIEKTTSASRDELLPGVRVVVVAPSQQQGTGGSVVATSVQIVSGEVAAPSQTPRAKPQTTPASAP